MSPADVKFKATIRVVTGSFLAGAAAMVMLGLVAPVAVKGGLSVRDAWASTADRNGPAVQPIDVAQVHAQLAAADRSMEASRAATEAAMARLDRLAGR